MSPQQSPSDLQIVSAAEEVASVCIDGIPPSLDGINAGKALFLGGLSVVAKGLILMHPTTSEKDLKERLRTFLDARTPRVEALLIDLAVTLWSHIWEKKE